MTACLPTACTDGALPWTTISTGRTYNNIAFDRPSEAYVASSIFEAPFELFDDERQPIWRADGKPLVKRIIHSDISLCTDVQLSQPQPYNIRSALELIVPGSWATIHG